MKRILIILLSFLIITSIGYFCGTKVKCDKKYILRKQNFLATIKEINNDFIKVKGFDSNEKDFRNKWFVIPVNNINIKWANEKIKIINLNKGDNVSISFTGEPTEKYPITINNVDLVELKEEFKTRRLIVVNNALYFDTKKIDSNNNSAKIDGQIKNKIKRNEIPNTNDTSNFATNLDYQIKNNNTIEVLIDNSWVIFERR